MDSPRRVGCSNMPTLQSQSTTEQRLMNLSPGDIVPLHGNVQSQVRRTNPLGGDALTCQLLVRLLHVALQQLPQQTPVVRKQLCGIHGLLVLL
jgi:hypothetical protein